MRHAKTLTEADILARVFTSENGDVATEIAVLFLNSRFDPPTTKKIETLLRKNNRGTISADERLVLDRYVRVGQLLDLMRAKAELSLRTRSK